MSNAPAGWYDDGSGQKRWWDGTAWTDTYWPEPSTPRGLFASAQAWSGRQWRRVVLVGAVILLIVVAASGGWGALLLALGLGGLAIGVFAWARGSILRIGIGSRKVASVVVVSAVVSMVIGSAVLGSSSAIVTADSATSSVTTPRTGGTAKETLKPTPPPTPERTVKTEEVQQGIPFESREVEDANLASGARAVTTSGVDGVRVITYEVTYEDGQEVSRTEVGNVITVEPVHQVTSIGTYVEPPAPAPAPAAPSSGGGCDPNYSGACVPIASDVDCAGGSGNGPAYVSGPVYVVGADIYDLDRDGDGTACD
jgi:hypothetical protein